MSKFECPHIELLNADTFVNGPPRKAYKELRQSKPVCWQKDPYALSSDSGYWAVTKQEHLDFVSKNPQIFSSQVDGVLASATNEEQHEGINPADNLLTMDPPKHIKYRRIVRNAFTPAVVESYGPHLEEQAKEIVSRILKKNQCEFVEEIASELPLIAICDILGVPAKDRKQFFTWSNTMIGSEDPDYAVTPEESMKAAMKVWEYADKIMEQHKDKPLKEDSVVSILLNSNVDGDKLEPHDFRAFMLLLIVAGNETTRNQTSHLMRLLIENPDQYQMLIDDPELISDAVEEGLRYNSPVISFKRTAVKECELGGKKIGPGDKVVLFYQSASSDETHFKDPDIFDITRPKRESVRENLRAFGIGEHFCLGSHLARLQLNTIFKELVKHIRNPQFNGETKWLYSSFISGIKSMPIKYQVA